MPDQRRPLLRLGATLLLIAAAMGLAAAIPLPNPHRWMTAHVTAIMLGTLLMVEGLVWNDLRLEPQPAALDDALRLPLGLVWRCTRCGRGGARHPRTGNVSRRPAKRIAGPHTRHAAGDHCSHHGRVVGVAVDGAARRSWNVQTDRYWHRSRPFVRAGARRSGLPVDDHFRRFLACRRRPHLTEA